MDTPYKWATNPLKLSRAQRVLGHNASEETLLAEYRKYAGLVNEAYVPEFTTPKPFIEPTMPLQATTSPVETFKAPEVGQTVVVPSEVVKTLTKASKAK